MGTCKTCKWWQDMDGYAEKFKVCNHSKIQALPFDVTPDDGAEIVNHDSLGLIPGPDFGCIHHEEKADATD